MNDVLHLHIHLLIALYNVICEDRYESKVLLKLASYTSDH